MTKLWLRITSEDARKIDVMVDAHAVVSRSAAIAFLISQWWSVGLKKTIALWQGPETAGDDVKFPVHLSNDCTRKLDVIAQSLGGCSRSVAVQFLTRQWFSSR
jgi:hypothetical protein